MVVDVIPSLWKSVRIQPVIAHLARICEYDRYQSSDGIVSVAEYIADQAKLSGLAEVRLMRMSVDGVHRWWSFDSPRSWTPKQATLEIVNQRRVPLVVDHFTQPCSLATYSSATTPGGIEAPIVDLTSIIPDDEIRGRIAIVDNLRFSDPSLLSKLDRLGAMGIITDAPCCIDEKGRQHSGRIELDPDSSLFGFSVTLDQFALIRHEVGLGARARVKIVIDRSAPMPVVSGIIPGSVPEDELWLMAHMCHPRPGANDNASGATALLGIGDTLSRLITSAEIPELRCSVRFIWGPEFVGITAFLHEWMMSSPAKKLPLAVLNLDMVGEDQSVCGGPFVVERGPEHLVSQLAPIAEHIVEGVFDHSGSNPGTWISSAFYGFSDNSVFADQSVSVPTIQLCHVPDRFNHSGADSIERVSEVEMLRTITAATELVRVLGSVDSQSPEEANTIIKSWCTKELASASRVAAEFGDIDKGRWSRDFMDYMKNLTDNVFLVRGSRACLDSRPLNFPSAIDKGVKRNWVGPFNVRAMLRDLTGAERLRAQILLRESRNRYSYILNFALRAGTGRDKSRIIRETSFALRHPIPGRLADELYNILRESGWIA